MKAAIQSWSIRRLFWTYCLVSFGVIAVLFGFLGFYLYQEKRNEIVSNFLSRHHFAQQALQEEAKFIDAYLGILEAGFQTLERQQTKDSIDFYSLLISQSLHQRPLMYNAYFALEKNSAKKLFGHDGFVLTTHRNPELWGRPDFYEQRSFQQTIYKDPDYQTNPEEVWYQVVRHKSGTHFTGSYFDKTYMKKWLITAARGIWREGQFIGMVGIDLLVNELDKILLHDPGPEGGLIIFDERTGKVLSASAETYVSFLENIQDLKGDPTTEHSFDELLNKKIGKSSEDMTLQGIDGHQYLIASASIPMTPWRLVTFQSKFHGFLPVWRALSIMAAISIVGMAVMVAILLIVRTQIAQPIDHLKSRLSEAILLARHFKFQSTENKIKSTGNKEVQDLSRLFNMMLRLTERNSRKQLAALERERVKSMHAAKMASLGEMASGIAHEVNNPLSIINGRVTKVERLLTQNPPDIDQAKSLVLGIESIVFRIAKIIRGLRTFSREASRDPYEHKNIFEIIEDAAELCREKFRHHGVRLVLPDSSKPILIECQPVQISQVLINLLNNSYDAVLKQTDKWVEIEIEETSTSISIRVTDSGPGIPLEIQDRIMDPFFTTKEVGKGTGLGLSLSKGIIESHDGDFFLDTSNSETTFVIELPKAQASEKPKPSKTSHLDEQLL